MASTRSANPTSATLPGRTRRIQLLGKDQLTARDTAQGAYIMPPFNKVELAVRVVEALE